MVQKVEKTPKDDNWSKGSQHTHYNLLQPPSFEMHVPPSITNLQLKAGGRSLKDQQTLRNQLWLRLMEWWLHKALCFLSQCWRHKFTK